LESARTRIQHLPYKLMNNAQIDCVNVAESGQSLISFSFWLFESSKNQMGSGHVDMSRAHSKVLMDILLSDLV